MRYINAKTKVSDCIYKLIIRLHLILRAIQGKPIIYGCIFPDGVFFRGNGVYVANNKIGEL